MHVQELGFGSSCHVTPPKKSSPVGAVSARGEKASGRGALRAAEARALDAGAGWPLMISPSTRVKLES